MKKPIVAFGALVLAAGISVGGYLAVRDKQKTDEKKKEEKAQGLVLFDFDETSINKMEIVSGDEKYTLERDDSTWEITEGDQFPLEQDYINLICSYASDMTASAEYSGSLEDYGLDSPSTVTLYSDDDSYTINVGKISPTNDYYYVQTGDRDGIYSMRALNGSILGLNKKFLRSKSIIPYTDDEIAGFTIIKDGKTTLQIERDQNGSWLDPIGYEGFNVDYSAMSSMTSIFTRIVIQDVLEHEPADLSRYGLDKPKGECIIKGQDGEEHQILVSEPYGNKDYAYVYISDDDQIVSCYTGDMKFLDYTPMNFIQDTYKLPDYNNVKGFELKFNSREDSFTFDPDKNTGTLNGSAFDINNDDLSVAFQTFYTSMNTLTVTSVDSESDHELKDPILTAVYHTISDGDVTCDIVDAGDKTAYLFIDGKYSGYNISTDTLTGKNSLVNFFEKFRDAAGIE